jgi:hypothetical protein
MLMGCSAPDAPDVTAPAPDASPAMFGALAPGGDTGRCPPAIPQGYTLHNCFNFQPINGVWHGFVLEHSREQPPETANGAFVRTRLNWDYLLVTPAGYYRLEAGGEIAPAVARDYMAFQAEYNGSEWFDVVRVMRGIGTRTGPITIAVVKRPQTVATKTDDLLRAVTSHRKLTILSPTQADALSTTLRTARRQFEEGEATAAVASYQQFIQQVRALLRASPPVLSPLQGEPLVRGAEEILARIGA